MPLSMILATGANAGDPETEKLNLMKRMILDWLSLMVKRFVSTL
jgi:hypothetical protein